MAVVGIARSYSTQVGFEHNVQSAQFVTDAIMSSSCSTEVKSAARKVGQLYGLNVPKSF